MRIEVTRMRLPRGGGAWLAPLAALWVVALALGAVGVFERVVNGHEGANYTSYIPWGLWVAVYVYFIGLSAGSFLVSALVYVLGVKRLEPLGKLALFTALVTLLVALLAIWLDLGHFERFWEVFTRGNPLSMMAWIVWLYTAYFLLLSVEFWFAVRADLVEWSRRPGIQGRVASILLLGQTDASSDALASDRRVLRVLGAIGVPLAVGFHGGVGALFGVVGARDYWNAPLYPLMFIVAALASGGGLLTFLAAFFGPRRGSAEHRDMVTFLGRMTMGLLVVYLVMLWAEFSIPLYTNIPAEAKPFEHVLTGPQPWIFWGFQIAMGSVIPLAIFVLRPRSVRWLGVASLLVAGAFLATRYNVVIPGLILPELEGLPTAYVDRRLSFSYAPSVGEWLVFVFIAALAVGIFYAGYRLLPVVTEKEAES